ncbi:MAG TPA: radical SAM protein [Candidatus Binatia bacterium]|jgi:hypothetical protein
MKSRKPGDSVNHSYLPEDCPFSVVVFDVTHRCNMHCRNCYIPNRAIPDMEKNWLEDLLSRLPIGRFIRLMGAEPTMRDDLPDLIRIVRHHRHHPVLVTNGLKLADRAYLRELKQAGLRVIYLSFSGGFDEDLYELIDGERCASLKGAALENACRENMYVTLGAIIVRDINEIVLTSNITAARSRRQIRELHFRSVGKIGRYMDTNPFTLAELLDHLGRPNNLDLDSVHYESETEAHIRLNHRTKIQVTQWPDLGSSRRGRVTQQGYIERAFEHIIANEFGY